MRFCLLPRRVLGWSSYCSSSVVHMGIIIIQQTLGYYVTFGVVTVKWIHSLPLFADQGTVATYNISLKLIFSSNLVQTLLSRTSILVVKSFWNCAQSTAVSYWYCCALCKISKRFDTWATSYGQIRFELKMCLGHTGYIATVSRLSILFFIMFHGLWPVLWSRCVKHALVVMGTCSQITRD